MAVVSIENETIGSSNQSNPVTKTRAFEHVPDNFGYVAPKKSTGTTGNESDLNNTTSNNTKSS